MRTLHPIAGLFALALPCAAQGTLPIVAGKQVAARSGAPAVTQTTPAVKRRWLRAALIQIKETVRRRPRISQIGIGVPKFQESLSPMLVRRAR